LEELGLLDFVPHLVERRGVRRNHSSPTHGSLR
jgi:hypothetical protein